MAVINASQIASYAYSAGFRGNALTMAIAIALAESGGNTTATNHNTNGSTDYGLWQINSSHSQYNPTLLLSNPAYNAQAAFQLSSNGSNWRPWCTAYSDGACGSRGGTFLGTGSPYQKYLAQAQAVVSGQGVATQPTINMQGLAWIIKYPITHGYTTNTNCGDCPHFADDIGTPFHTPIGSLVSGTVTQADYAVWSGLPGGGEVFIQPDAGGNKWYVYHLDLIQVRVGQHVNIGDIIGLSGGQNSGGLHNVSPVYSSGAHTHTGWFDGTFIMNKPHGPDITPYIQALKAGNIPAPGSVTSVGQAAGPYVPLTYTTLTSQVHNTLVNTPGFYGIALAVDEAEQFPGWVNLTEQTSSGLPDFVGLARSIGATISDNFIPFSIRAGIVALGLGLELMLILKPIQAGIEVLEGQT